MLIADGSLTARVHLHNTLANRGFTQVTDVSDSVKAVDALATLTRIDGQGLIEHIRQSPTTRTPVLLETTESAPAKLDALRRVGASALIDKSFRTDEVRAVLDPLFPTK